MYALQGSQHTLLVMQGGVCIARGNRVVVPVCYKWRKLNCGKKKLKERKSSWKQEIKTRKKEKENKVTINTDWGVASNLSGNFDKEFKKETVFKSHTRGFKQPMSLCQFCYDSPRGTATSTHTHNHQSNIAKNIASQLALLSMTLSPPAYPSQSAPGRHVYRWRSFGYLDPSVHYSRDPAPSHAARLLTRASPPCPAPDGKLHWRSLLCPQLTGCGVSVPLFQALAVHSDVRALPQPAY